MKHTSIIPHVCRKHGITQDELTGNRRYPHLVEARREVIKLMLARDYSLPRIGRALHRDHTTILHHAKAMKQERSKTKTRWPSAYAVG